MNATIQKAIWWQRFMRQVNVYREVVAASTRVSFRVTKFSQSRLLLSLVTALRLVKSHFAVDSRHKPSGLSFSFRVHIFCVWSSRYKSVSCILQCFCLRVQTTALIKNSLKFYVNQVASRDRERLNKTRKCTCRKLIKSA